MAGVPWNTCIPLRGIRDGIPGQGPTTKRELQQALDNLILRALENGVPIDNGGYELRHDHGIPDFELMIFRLEKSDDDDN